MKDPYERLCCPALLAQLPRLGGNDAGTDVPCKWRESTTVGAVGRPSLHLTYPCQLAETLKEEGDDSMSGKGRAGKEVVLAERSAEDMHGERWIS